MDIGVEQLRRTMMRRLMAVLIMLVVTGGVTFGTGTGTGTTVTTDVQTTTTQVQNTQAIANGYADSTSNSSAISLSGGGSADSWSVSEGGWSDSDSSAILVLDTTSISNYKSRVAPLTTYPPYLPMWQHGGWGTIKAYFANGPTSHDKVYERTFDPESEVDIREIKGILKSLPYSGALEMLGGFLNGVGTWFGGPSRYHHGRGFDIANSVIRDRRPEGKPLLVFIDSYVDAQLLEEAGYAYVGRMSLEGNYKRNWDHVYNAAVAEALPWDVDVLLISGGMKGVTVGATTSVSGGGGYSQSNYSLSLLPGTSRGVTEGVGEAVMSATAYRFCPEMLERRRIPQSLYDRIRVRPQAAAVDLEGQMPAAMPRSSAAAPAARAQDQEGRVVGPDATGQTRPGIRMRQELYDMAGFAPGHTVDHVRVR
jgi:hypothetical protein